MLEQILNIDRSWELAINGLQGNPIADASVATVTWCGHAVVIFLVSVVIMRIFGKKLDKRTFWIFAISVALGGLIANGMKEVLPRARPPIDPVIGSQIKTITYGLRTHSFPSGHAQTAVGAATVVAAEAGVWAGLIAFAIAGAVCFSRMYLGVHFPSDVAVGALIGLVSSLVVIYIARTRRRPKGGADAGAEQKDADNHSDLQRERKPPETFEDSP
ncbi:MAG: phosphatase PAP2 family protein [Myxococcota bacterium]|jgi:undecaprenyl-diphosphatase